MRRAPDSFDEQEWHAGWVDGVAWVNDGARPLPLDNVDWYLTGWSEGSEWASRVGDHRLVGTASRRQAQPDVAHA